MNSGDLPGLVATGTTWWAMLRRYYFVIVLEKASYFILIFMSKKQKRTQGSSGPTANCEFMLRLSQMISDDWRYGTPSASTIPPTQSLPHSKGPCSVDRYVHCVIVTGPV